MYFGKVWYIGMTQNGQVYHDTADSNKFYAGTLIPYESLTVAQKEAVIAEYEACWDVTITHTNGHCTKIWCNVKEAV
jgi:hypothetical protein